eukprot:RCo049390
MGGCGSVTRVSTVGRDLRGYAAPEDPPTARATEEDNILSGRASSAQPAAQAGSSPQRQNTNLSSPMGSPNSSHTKSSSVVRMRGQLENFAFPGSPDGGGGSPLPSTLPPSSRASALKSGSYTFSEGSPSARTGGGPGCS